MNPNNRWMHPLRKSEEENSKAFGKVLRRWCDQLGIRTARQLAQRVSEVTGQHTSRSTVDNWFHQERPTLHQLKVLITIFGPGFAPEAEPELIALLGIKPNSDADSANRLEQSQELVKNLTLENNLMRQLLMVRQPDVMARGSN